MDEEMISVLSTDPEKRKLARQLRIQQRAEYSLREDNFIEHEVTESSETERQISSSSSLLKSLLEESREVLSNVRVANDAKELARRKRMQEMKERLTRELEENAERCLERYNMINEKWDAIVTESDVLNIHGQLEEQNKRCLEVLAMKDEVIAELKRELENCDANFAADQLRHNEEIDLLIDRIDNQVNVMNKSYNQELFKIDSVLENERKSLIETMSKQWDALFEKFERDNLDGIELRKKIMQEYENQIDKLVLQHYEDYRAIKINLETEYQKLQREFEYTKSLCMLNVEKLNYNYIVLKHKDEENAIIRNYQRKKLNKLQDDINEYKKNISKTKQLMSIEKQKLTEQIVQSRNKIMQLEMKSNNLATSNDNKFFSIWDMNTENANELLNKVLDINREVYEDILGLKWTPPKIELLKKEDLPSYNKAKAMIEKKESDVAEKIKTLEPINEASDLAEINLERQLLHKLFVILSDKSEIFIEERLCKILENFSEPNSLIIKLDSVFKALEIESEREIKSLFKLFLPYLYCSICDDVNETTLSSLTSPTSSTEYQSCREKILAKAITEALNELSDRTDELTDNFTSDGEFNESVTCAFQEDEIKKDDTIKIGSIIEKLQCPKGHSLEIKTAHVISVLKDYVTKHSSIKSTVNDLSNNEEKLRTKKCTISRNMSIEDITNYWTRYTQMFSQKDEELWDALMIGLKKYLGILKERQKLVTDISNLKQQNFELNHLLQTYDVTMPCKAE